MNFFEKVIFALQKRIETPKPFDVYHLCCLAIVLIFAVFICIRFRNANEKTARRIILIAWACMVVGEIYKQLVFSMGVVDGIAEWSYHWHSFPFQLCSTPLYVMPIAAFASGRLRDAARAYLMTFSLLGGIIVMIYPADVFTSMLGIDIQTMIHHGLQVAIGIFLAVYERKRLNFRHFSGSLAIFAVAFALALGLNIGLYQTFLSMGKDPAGFNMFYISPYYDCTLPLAGTVHDLVPYPVFLLIYLVVFSAVALIIYYTVLGLYRLTAKKKSV